MKALLVVLAVAGACCAGAVHADSPGKKAGKQPSASAGSSDPSGGIDLQEAFKQADIDGDGQVSKAEAAGNARLVTGFDRADRNHDGQLSRREFDFIYRMKPRRRVAAAGR